jgi:LDH2 family malate/lactate/ureidoglycolate dehydrogenase
MAEIVYPGEQAAGLRLERRRRGIDVDFETWQRLEVLARQRSIQVPSSG